jgi:hypothetical protein
VTRAWALAAAMLLAACGTGPGAASAEAKRPLPPAPPPPALADEPLLCTADVQACPDGSFVSRDPAQGCAFRPCPGAVPSNSPSGN